MAREKQYLVRTFNEEGTFQGYSKMFGHIGSAQMNARKLTKNSEQYAVITWGFGHQQVYRDGKLSKPSEDVYDNIGRDER